MIATDPDASVGEAFAAAGGAGNPATASWRSATTRRSHGAPPRLGAVPLVLRRLEGERRAPGTAAFSAASVAVREDDVAEQIPCGADIEQFLERIAAFKDAGFTHLALVQVGGDYQAPSSSGRSGSCSTPRAPYEHRLVQASSAAPGAFIWSSSIWTMVGSMRV